MSESECRHLPAPVFNPVRCGKCGATLREPPDERLLAAAKVIKPYIDQVIEHSKPGDVPGTWLQRGWLVELSAAIAAAARGRPSWPGERPTVPGWYWVKGVRWTKGEPSVEPRWVDPATFPPEWRVEFCGPIAPPVETEKTSG